jgi:hypothetical protein
MLGVHQIGLGGAGLFVPTDLGSTLVGLYDSAGIVHSGASLTGWNDSSGTGNHLAGVGGYVADNGGGHPAGTFSGASGQGIVGPTATKMRSWFAVISDVNCVGAYEYLCASGPIYGSFGGGVADNQLCVYTNTLAPISGQTIGAGRHSVGLVMRAANDIDFYLDGAKVNKTTGSSFYMDLKTTMACDNGGSQRAIVHFEHMSLCDTALGSVDVANMFGYIQRTYGV